VIKFLVVFHVASATVDSCNRAGLQQCHVVLISLQVKPGFIYRNSSAINADAVSRPSGIVPDCL